MKNCQVVGSETPVRDTRSHRQSQPPFGEDRYRELLLMRRTHLLETEVEAVCALGWHLDEGEILFEQVLFRPLVGHTA